MSTVPPNDLRSIEDVADIANARALLERHGYRVDRVSTPAERERTWTQLYGRDRGVAFNVFDPDPALITVDGLAHGLAHENRWAAQGKVVFPVGLHSYRGSLLLSDPADAVDFLFHDGSEGLGLRDLPAPLKRAPEMAFYREREHGVMSAIAERFALRPEFWRRPAIKEMDERMLHLEQQELLALPPAGHEWGVWLHRIGSSERPACPPPFTPRQVKRLWLGRLAELAIDLWRLDLAAEAHEALRVDVIDELAPLVRTP